MRQKNSKPLRPLTEEERKEIVDYFEANAGYLHYLARLFISRPEDEEDVIQNCLLHVIDHIDTFLSLNAKRKNAYAARIIHNLCIDDFRRQKRVELTPLDDQMLEIRPSSPEAVPGSDTHLALLDLAANMPEKEWYVLQQLYLEGASKESVAAALHCSPQSVRSLACKARASARKILNIRKGGRNENG